jgi:FkbM family methyltransferase
MVMHELSISAAGRVLRFVGNVESYVKGFQDYDADSSLLTRLTRDLPQGSIIFDVGANIGIVTVVLAVQRPDFRIRAFEPVPSNVECLRRNLQANGIRNVEVVEAIVGDKPGKLQISDNGPWSSVGDAAHASAMVWAKVVTLDDYADEPVAFLKIDTEGYEPHVLAGARELLQRAKPLVFTEFSSWWYLEKGVNPIQFSRALMDNCDILAIYHGGQKDHLPENDPRGIAILNMLRHGCSSDVLLRPRNKLPELDRFVMPQARKPSSRLRWPLDGGVVTRWIGRRLPRRSG